MNRYNSNIKIKPCKCGCGKMPKLGYNGYAGVKCMPEELAGLEKYKKSNVANRNRANRANLSKKVHSIQNDKISSHEAKFELNRKIAIQVWFLDRRKEMTGKCACGCGQNSSRKDEKYWKYSIAHVLMKSKFPSVSTHKDNFVELAFWGGCHSVLDDKGYEYCMKTKPILWEIIVSKFKKIYPFISPNEHKFIPDVLLQEINQI